MPRYYKEFDQIPIKLTFKDSVEKEGSKKKKKKADDDDKPKEIPRIMSNNSAASTRQLKIRI